MELSPNDYRMIVVTLIAALTLILSVGSIYIVFRKIRKNNNIIPHAQAMAELSYYAKCPKCGRDMESGFVLVSKGIHWRSEAQPKYKSGGAIWSALANTANVSMSTKDNKAFRCEACQVLTIDHSCQLQKTK